MSRCLVFLSLAALVLLAIEIVLTNSLFLKIP